MAGYRLIQKIRQLEEEVDQLGFKMIGASHYYRDSGDVIALTPKDAESLPVFSRDAEIFVGTIENLEVWLMGLRWARDYDRMLKVSDDKRRARKEQDHKNINLVKILKQDEKSE